MLTPEATQADSLHLTTSQLTGTDSVISELLADFPHLTACDIRISVLRAEEDIWPRRDRYVLLDRARELLQQGKL